MEKGLLKRYNFGVNKLTIILVIPLLLFFQTCRNFDKIFLDPSIDGVAIFQDGVNGYSGTRDTHIMEYDSPPFSDYDDNNAGANDRLEGCRYLGPDPSSDRGILISFDVTSIPETATVTIAILELFYIGERNGSGASKTLNAHQITSSWIEGNGTGDYGQDVDGVTVIGVNWLTQPTYNPVSLDSETITDTLYTWHSFDITSAVQSWVSNSSVNFGICLVEDSPSFNDGTKLFTSSENTSIPVRPKLIVNYL